MCGIIRLRFARHAYNSIVVLLQTTRRNMLAGEKIPKNYFRLARHETSPGNSGPWSVLKTAANNAQSGSQLTKMLTGYILHPDQPGETAVVNQGSMTALRWKAADHYLDLSRVAGWHEEEQAAKVQAYTNTINNYHVSLLWMQAASVTIGGRLNIYQEGENDGDMLTCIVSMPMLGDSSVVGALNILYDAHNLTYSALIPDVASEPTSMLLSERDLWWTTSFGYKHHEALELNATMHVLGWTISAFEKKQNCFKITVGEATSLWSFHTIPAMSPAYWRCLSLMTVYSFADVPDMGWGELSPQNKVGMSLPIYHDAAKMGQNCGGECPYFGRYERVRGETDGVRDDFRPVPLYWYMSPDDGAIPIYENIYM